MMITAVIGACAAAAKTAPIPDQSVRAGRAGQAGQARVRPRPKALPSIAPMNSDGAKTPPEPPIAMVRLVATILPTSSAEQEPEHVVAADGAGQTG